MPIKATALLIRRLSAVVVVAAVKDGRALRRPGDRREAYKKNTQHFLIARPDAIECLCAHVGGSLLLSLSSRLPHANATAQRGDEHGKQMRVAAVFFSANTTDKHAIKKNQMNEISGAYLSGAVGRQSRLGVGTCSRK